MPTKVKNLIIKKGWFFAAGNIYHWKESGYHVFGVGISFSLLESCETLRITMILNDGIKEKYTLDCKMALAFAERFRSYKYIRGRKIVIVSKDILNKLID